MDVLPENTARKLGQACDRCRKKKIKCDGELPKCRNCTRAEKPCEASAPLQRNTRVRGFVTDDKRIQELQIQLLECQRALQVERQTTSLLRQQLVQYQNPPPGHHGEISSLPNAATSLSGPNPMPDEPAHIIKHMGRLVHDSVGVGRFAGSTTGVHFVLSVEETCRQTLCLSQSFPESCYNLYLAGPASGIATSIWSASPMSGDTRSVSLNQDFFELLKHPSDFYTEQIERFFSRWEAFCPVLARKQLVDAVHKVVNGIQQRLTPVDADYSTLCILLCILGINCIGRSTHHSLNADMGQANLCLSNADALQPRLVARGDIYSLQGLVLLSFYYQLTGHSVALIRLNGSMVRIAQSLGLHRHARRFRMKLGEIELRKRLWWWIYTFDRITAMVHGLPPLISDADVDNELSADCNIDDFSARELVHPFPGQTTAVAFFNHYTILAKKISSILNLLYTTTQRRQGVAKIQRLDRDLRVWTQDLGLDDEALETDLPHPQMTVNGCGSMILWLRLLSRFCIILINRPALTFDDKTREFAACLTACITASTETVHLLWLSDLEQSFLYLCPFGPGLVFQCALMHVYCQCKSKIISLTGMPTVEESITVISNAINILVRYRPNSQPASIEGIPPEDGQPGSIDSAIEVLKGLILLLQNSSPQPLSWPAGSPLASTQYAIPTTCLYDLNYMTAMDWAQDISDTFDSLPDLGG
ncbi:fungal-specific transcription factor domain-containing protein [Aspergillus heterothallicus]